MQLDQRKAFGLRVRALRTDRDLSQERLGELAGLDRQTIGNWELAATSARLDEMTAVAAALGVRVRDLFDG